MKRVRKTLKKYFIPHEENDHKPHILRAKSVAFVLVVALAVEGMLWFGTAEVTPRSQLFGIIVANALIDETNQNRVANAEPALTVSPLLTAAAQDKANDMVANDYFAHTSPSGLTPWYWFEQVGYNFADAGENLAVNFSDSEDVTNAWMNSPEHRANILDSDFTQIGMATAQGTYEGHPAIFVVELFGTPVPPAPPGDAIPFVNGASAAGLPATTGVPAAKSPTKPKQPSITTRMATDSLSAATSDPAFAAAITSTTPTATAPVASAVPGTITQQANPIQRAAANPRRIVDYLYLFIIALFALALGINVFVKIRVQHAQVIFGGMLVILVAGLLIVLNQHLLAGAAIL